MYMQGYWFLLVSSRNMYDLMPIIPLIYLLKQDTLGTITEFYLFLYQVVITLFLDSRLHGINAKGLSRIC